MRSIVAPVTGFAVQEEKTCRFMILWEGGENCGQFGRRTRRYFRAVPDERSVFPTEVEAIVARGKKKGCRIVRLVSAPPPASEQGELL